MDKPMLRLLDEDAASRGSAPDPRSFRRRRDGCSISAGRRQRLVPRPQPRRWRRTPLSSSETAPLIGKSRSDTSNTASAEPKNLSKTPPANAYASQRGRLPLKNKRHQHGPFFTILDLSEIRVDDLDIFSIEVFRLTAREPALIHL